MFVEIIGAELVVMQTQQDHRNEFVGSLFHVFPDDPFGNTVDPPECSKDQDDQKRSKNQVGFSFKTLLAKQSFDGTVRHGSTRVRFDRAIKRAKRVISDFAQPGCILGLAGIKSHLNRDKRLVSEVFVIFCLQ